MYTEWKKTEFPREYWKQREEEVGQEIDDKMK
jgi:hypothetical protein